MPPATPPNEATIREQAYYFWEEEGRPAGRDTEFWMRALVAVTEKSQLSSLTEDAPVKKTRSTRAATSAATKPTAKVAKPRKK